MTQCPGEILIVVKLVLQSEKLIPLAQLGLSRAISAIHRSAAGLPSSHLLSHR